MTSTDVKAPAFVRVLAVFYALVGMFTLIGSLFLWGEGFLFAFPAGVDYAFPVTDILVNAPASFIAAVGLWTMRRYGYVAAQFCAGFYLYASIHIFVTVAQSTTTPPGEMTAIVVPQVVAVLMAAASVVGLWPIQEHFEMAAGGSIMR
jgi:hypothetical protein